MNKMVSYQLMTLGLSSLSFGLLFGFYSLVTYHMLMIALFTGALALLYGFMMFGLFAFPLQMILQKTARTFSLMYLSFYIVLAFISVFLFYAINEPASISWIFQSNIYYMLSIASAVIYWFWDSLILYKRVQLTGNIK
ncbi:hypothetical protein BN2127_JRS7_03026 [Bacillus subtilis]|uniref:UPF0715 family protein n=1 Tax=Bacillus spizizenii TaxID=96241 RepID=UPI0006A84376|nr:UPF0715 family protein [Bacillus spizizenii]KXJ38893.1 hypothetical protein AX282_13655 [Bacillus spizizenii]CUB28807.1 hypothetical protein BN2127_JRS1_08974 [Bacillus cereus]CUB42713.1 hypothetical protein BN2127_JRS7_03026 [Bacillus subtilis]